MLKVLHLRDFIGLFRKIVQKSEVSFKNYFEYDLKVFSTISPRFDDRFTEIFKNKQIQ